MSLKGILKKIYTHPEHRDTSIDEKFVHDQVTSVSQDEVEELVDNEAALDRKFSGSNSLAKYAELSKIMLAMVKDMRAGEYRSVPWFTIATIVVALLYVLNPMDVIPDFIPGLGYIDDLAVLSIGIGWIESDLHKYLDWKIDQGRGI